MVTTPISCSKLRIYFFIICCCCCCVYFNIRMILGRLLLLFCRLFRVFHLIFVKQMTSHFATLKEKKRTQHTKLSLSLVSVKESDRENVIFIKLHTWKFGRRIFLPN